MNEQQRPSAQVGQRRRESDKDPRADTELKQLIEEKGGLLVTQDADIEISREYFIQNITTGDVNVTLPEAPTEDRQKKEQTEKLSLLVGKPLGHGGFGDVYAAQLSDEKTARDICIKQAKYSGLQALINENDIFSHLRNHPNDFIIDRLFLCQCDEVAILGLEYIPGKNLSEFVAVCKAKQQPFPHGDMLNVLRQQTNAINFIRANGIVHCDIKPENIMYNTKTKTSKLIDFGLAVFKTGVNELLVKRHGGTTEFMALETLVDQDIHEKSDIYGLGATLYNLAMLQTPWHFMEEIKELYAEKLDQSDAKAYRHLKDKRRTELRTAIINEVVEYRQKRTHVAHNQPSDNQQCPRTALQENLWNNRAEAKQHDLVVHIICEMLAHDSNMRPTCDDIEAYLVQYGVVAESHITKQMSRASLNSQSSSSSSGSDGDTTPTYPFQPETTSDNIPAVIHHSSNEDTQSEHLEDESLPNIGIMTQSTDGRMSISQSSNSHGYSAYNMSTDYPSGGHSSHQPSGGDGMNDYLKSHSQYGQGDHNYLDDNEDFLPVTISSAGSAMRPSQPTREETKSTNYSSMHESSSSLRESNSNQSLTEEDSRPLVCDDTVSEYNIPSNQIQIDSSVYDMSSGQDFALSQQAQNELNLTKEGSRQVHDDMNRSGDSLTKTITDTMSPLSPPNNQVTAARDDDDDDYDL